jgi:hypothetical protein
VKRRSHRNTKPSRFAARLDARMFDLIRALCAAITPQAMPAPRGARLQRVDASATNQLYPSL